MSKLFSRSPPPKVPTHTVSEEILPPATTANPNVTHKTSLSRLPSIAQKQGSGGHRHARKISVSHTSISSQPSSTSSGNYTAPVKAWDTNDSYLPRAKPPPPLPKLSKRNRTKKSPASSSASTLSTQPSMSQTSSLKSRAPSSRSASTERSLVDTPILDIAREQCGGLTRVNTLVTASSGTSEESAHKACAWKPPSSWAGPSVKLDGHGLMRFASRKRGESRSREDPADGQTSEVFHFVDVKPGEGSSGRYPSTGVKIRCYEGGQERPVDDVVHMLRELKLK